MLKTIKLKSLKAAVWSILALEYLLAWVYVGFALLDGVLRLAISKQVQVRTALLNAARNVAVHYDAARRAR